LLIQTLPRFLCWIALTFVAANHRLFIDVLYMAGHFILLHFNPLVSVTLFLNSSLTGLAILFSIVNTHYLKKEYLTPRLSEEKIKPAFIEYTVKKYNNTVKAFFDGKGNVFVDMVGFTMLMGSILSEGPVVNSVLDWIVHLTKFSWILSITHFILHNLGFMVFDKSLFLIDVDKIETNAYRLRGKRVIFILPTNGKNLKTVTKSVQSVVYWSEIVKRKLNNIPVIASWIIVEEDNYMENLEFYEDVRRLGCRIIVVPKNFQTANKTQHKARALAYALEVMRREQLATENVWIYHQDDETMVGEDTIFGIMDYIEGAGPRDVYAAGIIIYPDGWKGVASQTQEPVRSYDDMRILFTTKIKRVLSFGHHGSHLLVRADAEERIGWDFGNVKAEDWIFGLRILQEYWPFKTVLKGFEGLCLREATING